VAQFISSEFIPVKIHVKEQPETFKRFGAQWTPTLLVMSPEGVECHRIEGFLPADDLIAELALGLGKVAFKREDYAEAERRYRFVYETYPKFDKAAEAVYWAGVSRYKSSNDAKKLEETEKQLTTKYPGSEWARKGSVWAHS